ncbi:hypothetical protein SAMN05216232_3618 [Virgibacillus subterraneus]|uniref:DUF4352 domain-containing protein n=2 Tax=Virgibacillus TaxID=84406 RepID=A0A1H1DRV7_9BACI|nr:MULTISPECIES: hypothetical protein [Virgibacillus]SDQ78999.1 hypothetical protein SAMN05216231_2537 [Virgibacillus salinus]SEQ89799.1 hypothetical protein SAMN05216232_3618 [Virgibacillus subterraneus]
MRRLLLALLLLSIPVLMVGCNSDSDESTDGNDIGNPDAEQLLAANKDADIFATIDVVYINAENVSWVNELELSLGDEYFEITKQSTTPKEFESGTASKLPVGTKIYNPAKENGPILIAVIKGKKIPYLGVIEG